jgi:protein kinase-like protein
MTMPNTEKFPTGLTVDFQPARASVGHLPLALGSGSDLAAAEDLRTLLQRRLRFLFLLLVALLGIASILTLATERVAAFRLNNWTTFACALVSAILAGLVWVRPFSLRQLRTMDLVLVGILATRIFSRAEDAFWGAKAQQALQSWRETGEERVLGDCFNLSGCSLCLTAAIYIVAYGVCIPNTWRRCVLMVGLLWGIAPVMWVVGCATTDVPWSAATNVRTLFVFLDLTFAAALAVYGSHRVETLRQEAVQARRLGQYVLRARLGTGGMGEVYRADHLLLRRPCAIKLIRPDRAGDPQNLQRFEREVQATATLTHPNAVQIFDYGRAQDGTFYYVMEYLPGLTLEEIVKRHGPLPPARAIHFLRQLCGTLDEAHAIGLLHRDIKPGNVLVCERGGRHDVVKLLDFGLVRSIKLTSSAEQLTQEGTIAGTPEYMSPEHAASEQDIDGRSDLYSLGAVAYYILTGKPPFVRDTPMRTLAAHINEFADPPSRLRPDIPKDLEDVVIQCLKKDPMLRFRDARALEQALARCKDAEAWTEERAAEWWRVHRPSGW